MIGRDSCGQARGQPSHRLPIHQAQLTVLHSHCSQRGITWPSLIQSIPRPVCFLHKLNCRVVQKPLAYHIPTLQVKCMHVHMHVSTLVCVKYVGPAPSGRPEKEKMPNLPSIYTLSVRPEGLTHSTQKGAHMPIVSSPEVHQHPG